jgi:hypothetical protein
MKTKALWRHKMKKLIIIAVVTALLTPSLAISADSRGNKKVVAKKNTTSSRGITSKRDGNWSKIKDLFM